MHSRMRPHLCQRLYRSSQTAQHQPHRCVMLLHPRCHYSLQLDCKCLLSGLVLAAAGDSQAVLLTRIV